jgi:hypothetical protein
MVMKSLGRQRAKAQSPSAPTRSFAQRKACRWLPGTPRSGRTTRPEAAISQLGRADGFNKRLRIIVALFSTARQRGLRGLWLTGLDRISLRNCLFICPTAPFRAFLLRFRV